MPREVRPHMMQATTMTKISEKSIVMGFLFFLGWCSCLALEDGDDADADAEVDIGTSEFENKRGMESISCSQKLCRLERSGRALKIYNTAITSQKGRAVAEAFAFPSFARIL